VDFSNQELQKQHLQILRKIGALVREEGVKITNFEVVLEYAESLSFLFRFTLHGISEVVFDVPYVDGKIEYCRAETPYERKETKTYFPYNLLPLDAVDRFVKEESPVRLLFLMNS
jgi:hypothetical protein